MNTISILWSTYAARSDSFR